MATNAPAGDRLVDLADEPLRFFAVWSYLIVYRPARPAEIVRVVHGARNLVRALRGRRR